MLVCGANRFNGYALAVEADGVRRDRRADDRAEVGADSLELAVAAAQQVQVARRTVGLIGPKPQQHRAFEHEAITALRCAEAVQEALEAIAREKVLVAFAGRPCAIEQSRSNRSAEVCVAGHAIESR